MLATYLQERNFKGETYLYPFALCLWC